MSMHFFFWNIPGQVHLCRFALRGIPYCFRFWFRLYYRGTTYVLGLYQSTRESPCTRNSLEGMHIFVFKFIKMAYTYFIVNSFPGTCISLFAFHLICHKKVFADRLTSGMIWKNKRFKGFLGIWIWMQNFCKNRSALPSHYISLWYIIQPF